MIATNIESAPRADSNASNLSRNEAVAKSVASKPGPDQSHPQSGTGAIKDTVQISSAAQTLLKEVGETPAQTAEEANRGDHQAQRLLSSEAAARKF